MKNAIVYLIVFAGIQCGVTLGVSELWKIVSGSPDITSAMLITTMLVYSALTMAIFLLARWCRVAKSYVRSRPWTALTWSALAAVGAIVPSLWLQEQMPELPNWLTVEFQMLLKDRWGYLAVGLLAPVAEEMVFRGAILKSLLGAFKSHWLAIAVSALLFAAVHLNPAQMPHAFLVGLLIGWMYYRTDSIVPGVAYHWVNNTIAYILYNVLPDPEVPLIVLLGDSQKVMLSLAFSLLILLPAIYQLNVWLKKAERQTENR